MNRREFLKAVPAMALLASRASSLAQDAGVAPSAPEGLKPVQLPKPERGGGKSVLAALQERRTIRRISDKPLPPQVLSNLLWAAWGVNRKVGPFRQVGRTAASASNSQEMDLYVFLPEGVYLYEAVGHRLRPVLAGDHRASVRRRRRRRSRAPVILVYVADVARYARARFQEPGLRNPETQKSYYNVATGLIAGNVYVFAASQGLAAWF
ncbi:MAG: nitroreductase family protein, partial [Planctomycetota bacterium]